MADKIAELFASFEGKTFDEQLTAVVAVMRSDDFKECILHPDCKAWLSKHASTISAIYHEHGCMPERYLPKGKRNV